METKLINETNQSLEVIHKSSRFTTPSLNNFFNMEPIYNRKNEWIISITHEIALNNERITSFSLP